MPAKTGDFAQVDTPITIPSEKTTLVDSNKVVPSEKSHLDLEIVPKDEHDPKKDSFVGAVFNFANSTIGSGVLGLPLVLYETGVVFGLMFIFLGAIISGTSLLLLQKSSSMMLKIDPTKRDYEDMGDYCYGKLCGYFVKIAVVFINFGAALSYLIILGSLFISIFHIFFGEEHWTANRLFATILIAAPVIILSCSQKIADLRFFSIMSLLCVLIFSSFVIIGYFTGITRDTRKGEVVPFKINIAMFRVLGVIVFAFACHTNVCPVNREFHSSNYHKVGRAIYYSVAICLVFYATVATFGYLSFLEVTPGNLVDAYKKDTFNGIFRIILAISIIFTYPMVSYPCRLSLDNLLIDLWPGINWLLEELFAINLDSLIPSAFKPSTTTSDVIDGETIQLSFTDKVIRYLKQTFSPEVLRMIVETIGIGIAAFFCAVYFPQVDVVFSLTGSTASTATSFILPGLMYAKLARITYPQKKWYSWDIILGYCVTIFGFCFGISVTTISIIALVKPELLNL